MLRLLFFEFLKISLFTIGGGLAMIPVIENTFVKKHKLLQQADIIDMIGITQTIPGLIAVNSAVYVGHKLAGWKGSLIATLGVILPSMIIIILIAAFFPLQKLSDSHLLKAFSCVRSCVLGLFIVLAYRIGKTVIKNRWDILLLSILIIPLFLHFPPILIVLISCVIGCGYECYIRPKIKENK